MSNYVVYHNPDKRGFPATECVGFSVLTNKSPTNVEGSRVWLLTGEGTPRKYYLAATFIAQHVGSGREDGFETSISADAGQTFRPMIPLDDEDWFADFRRSQANFSLGMQLIRDERAIRSLCQLAGLSN